MMFSTKTKFHNKHIFSHCYKAEKNSNGFLLSKISCRFKFENHDQNRDQNAEKSNEKFIYSVKLKISPNFQDQEMVM